MAITAITDMALRILPIYFGIYRGLLEVFPSTSPSNRRDRGDVKPETVPRAGQKQKPGGFGRRACVSSNYYSKDR
jgi:hypothetical protein